MVVSLSAQFLLDCTYPYVDHSGSRYAALALIKQVGGIPSESEYHPYWQVSLVRESIDRAGLDCRGSTRRI